MNYFLVKFFTFFVVFLIFCECSIVGTFIFDKNGGLKMKNIIVKDKNISIQSINDEDYISLTVSNSTRLKMKMSRIQLFLIGLEK